MLTRTLLLPVTLLLLFPRLGKCDEVSFAKDILPLLSDRCFQCHGPDENDREADLRLDLPSVVSKPDSAAAVIVAGNLEKSEVWKRIISDDPETVMPPTGAHRNPLSAEEREKIRRWILAGADWEEHWAFQAIKKPTVPAGENGIDFFINKRLEELGLKRGAVADKRTRLRRLSFALRGVSPSRAEMLHFNEMPSDTRWELVVDEYLASSLHAERLAMWWLDVARYSDSDGYQQDQTRQNWPWRDWVIQAFSDNMSFDQFTREQFAGDLVEGSTPEQRLATCFHRNHMANGEGGRDAEESRIDYVLDRTNTMGTVWLGLTLGCTQCHSHKFDPISQADYYSLTAFFNSIEEDGRAGPGAKPILSFESPFVGERIKKMEAVVTAYEQEERRRYTDAKEEFETWLRESKQNISAEYAAWCYPTIHSVTSNEGTEFSLLDDSVIQARGPKPNQDDYRIELSLPSELQRITGWRIEVLPDSSHVNGMFTRSGNGDFILTNVKSLVRQDGNPNEVELENSTVIADYQAKKNRETEWDTRYSNIRETLNDDARDGWTTQGAPEVVPHVGVYTLDKPYLVRGGDRFVILLKHRSTQGEASIGRFRLSVTSEQGGTLKRVDSMSPLNEYYDLTESERESPPKSVTDALFAQFLLDQAGYQKAKIDLDRAKRQLGKLKGQAKPRSVMVLKDRDAKRDTHVLIRGVWDKKGDKVTAGFLPSIYSIEVEGSPTRLDLANWLVSQNNPLTPRVMVNHLWQLIFGRGLVATAEDFGLQGEYPSHPKLLDWLAGELVDSEWDLRHVLRLIVSSQAFQRSSVAREELRDFDPDNRWLARGPRYRLDAWMLRDNALRIAGLLDEEIGGPPVYPYQPTGIWSEITMGRFQYDPSLGDEQYRRTIYAFWRRSSSPAFLFDSAQRRVCEVRKNLTNTPLQALTLLNDETYLECSRVLADALVLENDIDSASQQLARRVISREWSPEELQSVKKVYLAALDHYQSHIDDAEKFVTIGQQTAPDTDQLAKVAAWMTCASMALNLDEAITLE